MSVNWMRYKFQQQFIMKKARPQAQAITLSSKRGSLNQEQLFVPYKIDWKPSPPLQNIENNSSRAFFQNMKAELSTIKNDFERLIKKEGPAEKEGEGKSASKQKCQSAYKKDGKRAAFDRYPENDRLEIVMNNREDNDFFKILNLEKNLPCSSGPDFKNSCSKTINVKDLVTRESKTSPFEAIELQRNQRAQSSRGERPVIVESARVDEKDKELANLREAVIRLQGQLKETQEERDFTNRQAQRLFTEKNSLSGKTSELSAELSMKVDYILKQEQVIQRLQESVQLLEQQIQQRMGMEQQVANERGFYNERINELMFHNQNLGAMNMQLGGENQMLKENCENLQRFVEELQRRADSISADCKRKLEYIQRDIQEYQKREDMFSKEIEKLNLELMQAQAAKSSPIQAASANLEQSSLQISSGEDIQQLKDQIRHLTNQVSIEKEIHSALRKAYEEQIASLKIEEISREFEEKINRLADENCKLKTKVNLGESSLDCLREQNQSLLAQISLYEEREKTQTNRQLSASEWEQLTERIEALEGENKRLTEELELKGVKEGEQPELPASSCESLIRMANLQLFENERLKDTIRELSASLKAAEQRLQTLPLLQSRLNEAASPTEQGKRLEELQTEVQSRKGQISGLKELVFRVLIEKVGKLDDEEEMEYYLREIENWRETLQL